MKILIAVYSLTYGGAEKQAVVDANALKERGHDVTVVFYKMGDLAKLLRSGIKLYQINFKNVVLGALQLFYHCLKQRYDVLHGHMFWAEKIIAPGRLLGQRIIFNEHGLGVWRKPRHSMVMRLISKSAHVIANSCDATKKNRVAIDKMKPDKLMTLYNSFEADNTGNEISPPTKKKGHFTVAFVGRFDPVKRLELYIPLAEKLSKKYPYIRFLLIGAGAKHEELQQKTTQAGLEKYFSFPGFVLAPAKRLSACDAFFMPSKREAFSIALLEAAACALPAVAFNVGGNAELIRHGETGFIIENDDINAVAEKIAFLIENPEQRDKIGSQARRFVSETFSIKKRIGLLEKIYNEDYKPS